jgi:phage FluMu protein Com
MVSGEGSARFSDAEEAAVRETWREAGEVRCPRCRVVMRSRPITGGSFGLGYQRHREWLMCPRCKRSVLFDAARGTRT